VKSQTASALLQAIRSRGSDAETIRDAAHEATHALQTNLHSPWNRDNIHEAVERLAKRHFLGRHFGRMSALVRFELEARAVEMLTSQHFNEKYDIQHWATICWMETAKAFQTNIGEIDDVIAAIKTNAEDRRTIALFKRVLAIKPKRGARQQPAVSA